MPKLKKPMTLDEVEAQSRRNAQAIIDKKSKLKPWKHCKAGWYKSKTEGKWLSYRSGLELSFYKSIDDPNKIRMFDEEKVMIPYDWKGAKLQYVPDVLVKGQSGKVYMVEVKPAAQLAEDRNIAKWQAARAWCFNRGVKFLVVTEKNMQAVSGGII